MYQYVKMYFKKDIVKAVKFSLFNSKYKAKLKKCKNIYGTGNASKKIINILSKTKYTKNFLIKKYP